MTSIGERFIQSLTAEQLLELSSQGSFVELARRVDDYLDQSRKKQDGSTEFAHWFLRQDEVDELFASDDQLAEHLKEAIAVTTAQNRASSAPTAHAPNAPVAKKPRLLLDHLAALRPGTSVYDDEVMTTVDVVTADPAELTMGMSLWWHKIAQRGLDLPVKAWDTIVLYFHDNDAVAMFQKQQKPLGDDLGVRVTGFVDPRALGGASVDTLPIDASIESRKPLRKKAISVLSNATQIEPAASALAALMEHRPFQVVLTDRTTDDLLQAEMIPIVSPRVSL